MPHTGDGLARTTSSHREQVVDIMRYAQCPHDIVCSPELAQLDDPKPAISAGEGQSPGFNAITQAHRAHWVGPGTTTEERDILLASAALLEGEEKRTPIGSSEQAAAPTIPSTPKQLSSPATFFQSTPAATGQVQDPHVPPVQPRGSSRVHAASHIARNLNPQPGRRVAHAGTDAPHLKPNMQHPGAFTEDPEELGGVTMLEDGAPALPRGSKTTESAFAAETADAEVLQPRMRTEAKRSLDKPQEEPNEKLVASEAHLIAQGLLQPLRALQELAVRTAMMGPVLVSGLVRLPKPLAALVPPLIDPALAGATECAITQHVPYRGAVDTSNWAALATCPDTSFPDANGSMAETGVPHRATHSPSMAAPSADLRGGRRMSPRPPPRTTTSQ